MFGNRAVRERICGSLRMALSGTVATAILFSMAAPAAASEPMLQWLPGEGLVTSPAAADERPLITITPAGSPPASQLPFDLGELNEFRLQLGNSGVSLEAQDYVTRSLFGLDGIGAGLLVSGGDSLGWQLGASRNFSISPSTTSALQGGSFQPLAQIQCRDGVVSAQGYLGQDCRLNRSHSRLEAGFNWQPNQRVVTRAGVFDESVTAGQPGWALEPVPALPGIDSRGLNLDLELGLTTDGFGDWTLGVQVARILDGGITPASAANPYSMAPPDHFGFQDSFNSASLGLDWQLGNFGGGISSYYRAPIELHGNESLDELTSFDIYFSWQTPWDGSLRIGASNLTEENLSPVSLTPNSESDNQVYGRIPYVRYRQDL